VFTTRRICVTKDGQRLEVDPRFGIAESDFGKFKGIKTPGAEMTQLPIEQGMLRSSRTAEILRFRFETGKASMAPIYATMFWQRTKRFRRA